MRTTDTGGIGLSLENQYMRMVSELLRKRTLQSLADCVRDCGLLERVHVYGGDILMKFVKSGCISKEFCSTLRDYDWSQSHTWSSETGGRVLHK